MKELEEGTRVEWWMFPCECSGKVGPGTIVMQHGQCSMVPWIKADGGALINCAHVESLKLAEVTDDGS